MSKAFRYMLSLMVSTMITGLELEPMLLSMIDWTRPLDRP